MIFIAKMSKNLPANAIQHRFLSYWVTETPDSRVNSLYVTLVLSRWGILLAIHIRSSSYKYKCCIICVIITFYFSRTVFLILHFFWSVRVACSCIVKRWIYFKQGLRITTLFQLYTKDGEDNIPKVGLQLCVCPHSSFGWWWRVFSSSFKPL